MSTPHESPFIKISNPHIFDPAIFNNRHTIYEEQKPMHRYKVTDIPPDIISHIAPYNMERFLYSVSLVIHHKNIDPSHIDSVWGKLPIYLTREDIEYLKPKEGENIVEIWFNHVFAAVDFITSSNS